VAYVRERGDRRVALFADPQGEDRLRFAIRIREGGCSIAYSGVATARSGDMESRDDDAGHAHFVTLYTLEQPACGVSIAIDIESRALAWVDSWECAEIERDCSLASTGPLTRAAEPRADAGAQSFAALLAGMNPLPSPPLSFPPDDAGIAAIHERAVPARHVRARVCVSEHVACATDKPLPRVFHAYRHDLSDELVAVVYLVHGPPTGSPTAMFLLATYRRAGGDPEYVDSMILAGDMGEYGYDGEITAARAVARNRFVWVDGEDKEYVKGRSFRITPAGRIDETIR
jgi:hypothetical protein